MPEVQALIDRILVASPVSRGRQIPGVDQLFQNLLGESLGNSNSGSNITDARHGKLGNVDQNVSVVREESPLGFLGYIHG